MKYYSLSVGLLLSVALPKAMAQEAQLIRLDKAIDLAMANNSALQLSRDRITLADARFQQAKDRALPHLGASLQGSRLSIVAPFNLYMGESAKPAFSLPPTTFYSTIGVLSASKEIFTGLAEKSAHKSAELLREASHFDVEKDQKEIAYTVVAAYYNLYKIMKSAQILDYNMNLLNRKEVEVQNLKKEGVVTSNEVLKIQLQKSNLELSRVDVENARQTALYHFSILLGIPDGQSIAIDTTELTIASPTLAPATEYLQQAQGARAELKAGELRIKVAESNLVGTKSGFYPHVSASAMYIYLNPNKNVIPESQTFLQAASLGLSISYNIGSIYGMKGRLQEAKTAITQAVHQNTLQQDQIRSEVFSQYKACQSATEKISVTQTALAQATRSFQLTDSKFRNGLLLSSDLLESQSLLLQAQLNVLNAQVDAQLAFYRLQKAVGQDVK